MKTLEYTKETGKIKPFIIDEEIKNLVKIEDNKPSKRIIKTRKGKKAIAVLNKIENNHNHSWYKELKIRAKNNMDALAIFYRGNKITFSEMFEEADKIAKAMLSIGLKKGDEIPCCISNTPELIYIMLAANKIGVKLNLFGTHLDKDYLKKILNRTTNKLVIITDENYDSIKNTVNECNFENKLILSLADSLPNNPKLCDEYVTDLDKYYHFDNLVTEIKKTSSNVLSYNDFILLGDNYKEKIIDDNNLDTEFLVTYTSGSTNRGFPKQIIHSNRSLIVSGTFNDMELSGSPKIPFQRGMCYIHTESNTNLVTCISDNLMKLWSVACEPVYGKETALDVIRLNSPSMIEMTTSHLIQMSKDYLEAEKNGLKYKFPKMIATFAVGEPTSPGEEKLINTILKKAKAGSEVVVKGITLPYAPLSVGGGDCEHGGIFYNVFNNLKPRINKIKNRTKDLGMAPVVFGVITAMKENSQGKYEECNYNEYGVIVANTATNMVGYKDEKDKTLEKIIRDKNGNDWLSCGVYGYIDKSGYVHQRDRLGSEIYLKNGNVVLPSLISDVVLSDTKNVLSCSVNKIVIDDEEVPIINFELSPLRINSRTSAIKSLDNRIKSKLGNILGDNYLLREITSVESFPLAGSGKRDIVALEEQGLKNTFKIKNNNNLQEKSKKIYQKKI